MMKETKIRRIIREVIEELYNGNRSMYNPTTGTHFPYNDGNQVVPPNEIDTNKNYSVFKASAENQETYSWPEEEFDLGMSIEQNRSPELNMYDHAEVVINNLKGDKRFYSKLTEAK